MAENKKPMDETLQKKLTPLQYKVTQQDGTEPPFRNEYWDNHADGIYVDVVSGEPLFSSLDKYDSGTGWPSFTKPIDGVNLVENSDTKLGMERTEVRSPTGNSHLGHVFSDGPGPSGSRYCMNSASMRFVPLAELDAQGYGQFKAQFAKAGKLKAEESAPIKAAVTEDVAYLAGGCFWGMEELLRTLPGIKAIEVGYMGGTLPNPRYEQLHDGTTGYAESVKITFDPAKLAYEDILFFFFKIHDPTTLNQQGNDRGTQYRSAIFYTSPEQKKTALEVISKVNASGKWKKPIVTQVTPALTWGRGEEYHQDYLQKNPGGYTCHFIRE